MSAFFVSNDTIAHVIAGIRSLPWHGVLDQSKKSDLVILARALRWSDSDLATDLLEINRKAIIARYPAEQKTQVNRDMKESVKHSPAWIAKRVQEIRNAPANDVQNLKSAQCWLYQTDETASRNPTSKLVHLVVQRLALAIVTDSDAFHDATWD